jgi:probable F420-dependent oxidoreductase
VRTLTAPSQPAGGALTRRDVHVALGTRAPARADIIELGTEIDALGFGGLWVTESSSRDAFSLLTELATKTATVDLGTGIVNHYGRTPSTLAMAAASVAEIIPGRAVNLGLGASSRTVIEGFHGVEFDQPARRMSEAIDIIRAGAAGQAMDHQGQIFRLDPRFKLEFAGDGTVRILVAALSPAMLRIVGQQADGWLPIWPSRSRFTELLAQVEQAAAGAGRPRPWVASYIYAYVGDPEQGAAVLRRNLARYVAASGAAYTALFRSYGWNSEVDEVLAAWKDGDRARSSAAISDEMLADFCVIGDGESAARQLAGFRQGGIDTPIIRVPDGLGQQETLTMIRDLAAGLPAGQAAAVEA